MIMWDKVPKGTRFGNKNYPDMVYVFLGLTKDKKTVLFVKENAKMDDVVGGWYNNIVDEYLHLLDKSDIAKYTAKKEVKYYCHCGKELDDLIYTTCMDAAMSFVVCVNCGCVYSKIKSNNIGIPKEVDND